MNKIMRMVNWDFTLTSRSIKSVFSQKKAVALIQKLIFLILIVYILSVELFAMMYCKSKYGFNVAQTVAELFTVIFATFWTLLIYTPKVLDAADLTLLSVLPVKQCTLIKARMVYTGLLVFLLSLFGILPGLILATLEESMAVFGDMLLKEVLTVIIIATVIMLLISFCKFFSENKKNGKIISFLILIFLVCFYAFKVGEAVLAASKETEELVGSVLKEVRGFLFPFCIINSCNNYIVISIVIFAVILSLVSSYHFVKGYYAFISKNERATIKKIGYTARRTSLFRREIWVIKNYKGYMTHFVMETLLAPIVLGYLFGLIKIVGKYSEEIGTAVNALKEFEYGGYIIIALIVVIVLSQSSCLTPVSREGKLYYLTRILPIPSREIYINKFMISLLTTEISALLSYVIVVLLGVVKVDGIVSSYLLMASGIFACLSFASITDYVHPFISWDNVKAATNGNINVLKGVYKVLLFVLADSVLFVLIRRVCHSNVMSNIFVIAVCLLVGILSYKHMSNKVNDIYTKYDERE